MKWIALTFLLLAALFALAAAQRLPDDGNCNYLCAANYDPVCGVNPRNNTVRRTFNNPCLMQRENCRTGSRFQSLRRGVC